MKRLVLPLAALAIAGLILPAGTRPTYACFCVPMSVAEYVDKADVIVIGTFTRQVNTLPKNTFAVEPERYLKSSGPQQIKVTDAGSGTDCSILPGELSAQRPRYLLFLTGTLEPGASPLETAKCTGSLPLSGIASGDQDYVSTVLEQVEEITGPGTSPVQVDYSQPGESDVPWLAVIVGSSLGAVALAAASAWLLRRAWRV